MTRCLESARDREIQHPGAFLFGVARNVVRNRFERKSRSLLGRKVHRYAAGGL